MEYYSSGSFACDADIVDLEVANKPKHYIIYVTRNNKDFVFSIDENLVFKLGEGVTPKEAAEEFGKWLVDFLKGNLIPCKTE